MTASAPQSAVPTKEDLLRRTALIAAAEEQAAIAGELERLAREGDGQDLSSVSVVAAALEHASACQARSFRAWAAEADAEEDPLLARSLRAVAAALEALSPLATDAAAEAKAFSGLLTDED